MTDKICPVCETGTLKKVDNIISELSGYVFVEKGERCTHCGEEFISEKDAQKTINVAKQLGIWPEPLKMYRKLSRSGKNLTLRIPADLVRQLDLDENTEIIITKLGSKIILESVNN